MNRNSKFLFPILAVAVCLMNTACTNRSTAWDTYALVQDTNTQPDAIYGIKD